MAVTKKRAPKKKKLNLSDFRDTEVPDIQPIMDKIRPITDGDFDPSSVLDKPFLFGFSFRDIWNLFKTIYPRYPGQQF